MADFDEDCHGEVYDGADYNTARLDLLRDGVLIKSWDDADSDSSGTLTHIDKALEAETDYNYTLRTFNSDGDDQEGDIAEASDAIRTHDRPQVTVDTPNGLEIASINDLYEVAFSTTQKQYISHIEVFYLRDGDESCLDTNSCEDATDNENQNDTVEPRVNNHFITRHSEFVRGSENEERSSFDFFF